MNGIYALYFTGTSGSGFGVIILKDGVMTGADVTGGMFDGTYRVVGDEITGTFISLLPPGVTSVNGVLAGQNGLRVEYPIRLPVNLGAGQAFTLPTPNGPVNVIVKKLRDLA